MNYAHLHEIPVFVVNLSSIFLFTAKTPKTKTYESKIEFGEESLSQSVFSVFEENKREMERNSLVDVTLCR